MSHWTGNTAANASSFDSSGLGEGNECYFLTPYENAALRSINFERTEESENVVKKY